MGDVAHLPTRKKTPPSGIRKAATGSRLELLEALRDKVAAALDAGVPARELASLSRRLVELAREIEAAKAGTEGDKVGEAASKPNEPLY